MSGLDSIQDFQDASLKGKNQKLFRGSGFLKGIIPKGWVAAFSLTYGGNSPMLAPRKILSFSFSMVMKEESR